MITQKIYVNDIDSRLDCFFYLPEFLDLEKAIKNKSKKLLGDFILDMTGGATPKRGDRSKYSDGKSGVPFLRVQNITERGIDLTGVKFISRHTHETELRRSQLKPYDLLVTITGRIASSAVVPENFEGNINQHSVRIKTGSKVISEALATFLNSDIGQKLALRRTTGGTRPALDYEALKSIPIVYCKKISSIIQEAYLKEKEKLEQADELLNSIDGYVRQQLGITYTEPEEEKIYTVNSEDLESNRQDPYYYNPKFENLLNSVSDNLKMVSLLDISEDVFNGNTPAKDKYTEDGKPIVKVSCLKKNRIDWSNLAYTNDKKLNKHLKDNDILLLSSAHQAEYLGKNPCLVEIPDNLREKDITFVGELICIRPNTKLINPYYLLAILRLDEYHLLINREKRGQTSHIYPDDLEKIKIPLVDKGKQDIIGQEFKNRLSQADNLKNEASKLLDNAKKKVEEMILS